MGSLGLGVGCWFVVRWCLCLGGLELVVLMGCDNCW